MSAGWPRPFELFDKKKSTKSLFMSNEQVRDSILRKHYQSIGRRMCVICGKKAKRYMKTCGSAECANDFRRHNTRIKQILRERTKIAPPLRTNWSGFEAYKKQCERSERYAKDTRENG